MDAKDFIATWGPDGTAGYCFEPGITKTDSASARTDGWADVWRHGCFAWENKAPGKSLAAAHQAVDAVRTAAGERAAAGGV